MPNNNPLRTTDDNQQSKMSFPSVSVEDTLPPTIMTTPITTPNTVPQDTVNPSPASSVTADNGSAAPSNDLVMSGVVGTTPPKKKFAGGKVIATILGLFLLVGGVGAGIFLTGQNQDIREKAYTPTGSKLDTCGFVEVSFSESPECPRLENNTGQNNVSSYQTRYTLKNVTNQRHVLQLSRLSHYCIEPYGQINTSGGAHCGTDRQSQDMDLTLEANETKVVTISRSSLSGEACGSFQTDILLNSIDDNIDCHSPNTGNSTLYGWGMCQTGIPCNSNGGAKCQSIKVYSGSWTEYPVEKLSSLTTGNNIYLCASGTASSGNFDKAIFIINGVAQPETTKKRPGTEDYCYLYTLGDPNVNNRFNIRAKLHHVTLGWVD